MTAYQRLLTDLNSRPFTFNTAALFMMKVTKLIMKLFGQLGLCSSKLVWQNYVNLCVTKK